MPITVAGTWFGSAFKVCAVIVRHMFPNYIVIVGNVENTGEKSIKGEEIYFEFITAIGSIRPQLHLFSDF